MTRRNDITSTEKLLRVIRSRKAEPPMDDGSAGTLPPSATSAPIFRPDLTFHGESPVTIVDFGPELPTTNGGDLPERRPTPITLVIRDVRPNRPETPVPADATPSPIETVPDPVEAFPVPAEQLTIPAETIPAPICNVPANRNGRVVADGGEPALPRPSTGEADQPLPEASEPFFVAGDMGLTEPDAAILPEPIFPAEGEHGADRGEEQTTATAPSPKAGLFKKILPSRAFSKRTRTAETDSGPDVRPGEALPDAAEAIAPKTGHFRMALPGLASLQKTATVGIDIGHDYLRLVQAVKTAGGKWDIRDRRRFTLPPKTSRETQEFSSFLKSALASVCGSAKRMDLWVNMSAANVDVRHIRIPKVSKKQIANAVYWTVKKETPFDEKEMLLDFETQGEVIEQGITKLSVMVYTAPRREVEDLKELFVRIGCPLTGISIVPFSVQNLFRTGWITTQGANIASLFIGNDFSRIDIYAGNNLVMTRGIKAGMSSMVECLIDRFCDLPPGRTGPTLNVEQGRRIIRSLSPDSPPLEAGEAGFDVAKEALFAMILPALERLTRQAERTFEHFATTLPGERIARIYVSGAMNVYQPIVDYVGAQLGIASALLDPLSEQETAVCPDVGDAHCISERMAFGPALGLALSDNQHTPNLMFTYRDRDREASVIRINRAVFAAFIASVLICSGIFSYQNIAVAQKRAALARIETQIAQLGPAVDQNRLLQMAAKVTQRRQLSRVYAERYLGMVLISELAALTPENIRFTDLRINLGPARIGDTAKQTPEAAKTQRVEEVTVEGLILGERQLFETSLAAYAMALEASPLFRQVTVQKNAVEPYIKGEALHFILILKVEAQVHG